MNSFTEVKGAIALVRKPKGYYDEYIVYKRNGELYFAEKQGFVKIKEKFGDSWLTSNHAFKVVELTGVNQCLS